MANKELTEFGNILATGGLHASLRYLNARTPHRFTGVYRFDEEMLRSVCLVDRSAPEVERGDDLALKDAYCALVHATGTPLEFADARSDGRFEVMPDNATISYCGVLIRDRQGRPYGTLCHYDTRPCQERTSDVPLLEAAAPLIYSMMASAAR